MWATDNSERWHALFVATGHEEKISKVLQKYFSSQLKFIVPRRELRERKAGKWHKVKRSLFPGYILLKGRVTVETYYRLKKVPLPASLLKDEDGPQIIEEKELAVLNTLINTENGDVGISTAYRENDKVKVLDGPLVGLEGYIQSIDARKGRARVKINFLGNARTIQLGLDIIDKV